jgi:3D (Asp-Asp-Asp) domain-containing protein
MKGLTIAVALFFVCQALAAEHSALARVTVYWHREGSGEHASWNGARLRDGHCAVDLKKIPYGSKVVFPDATCVAVDSGPGVVNRKPARLCGRNASERNAIVIDRFFDTKQKALAWEKAHPHFMMVRILPPDTKQGTNLVAANNSRLSPTNIASTAATSRREQPNDSHQGFESSLDRAAVAVTRFIFAICQTQNIGACALAFAAGVALLATPFHSCIHQLFVK